MKDFIFRNDTKLFFRNDISETLAELTAIQAEMRWMPFLVRRSSAAMRSMR